MNSSMISIEQSCTVVGMSQETIEAIQREKLFPRTQAEARKMGGAFMASVASIPDTTDEWRACIAFLYDLSTECEDSLTAYGEYAIHGICDLGMTQQGRDTVEYDPQVMHEYDVLRSFNY